MKFLTSICEGLCALWTSSYKYSCSKFMMHSQYLCNQIVSSNSNRDFCTWACTACFFFFQFDQCMETFVLIIFLLKAVLTSVPTHGIVGSSCSLCRLGAKCVLSWPVGDLFNLSRSSGDQEWSIEAILGGKKQETKKPHNKQQQQQQNPTKTKPHQNKEKITSLPKKPRKKALCVLWCNANILLFTLEIQ